jgi:hypothetical protein
VSFAFVELTFSTRLSAVRPVKRQRGIVQRTQFAQTRKTYQRINPQEDAPINVCHAGRAFRIIVIQSAYVFGSLCEYADKARL